MFVTVNCVGSVDWRGRETVRNVVLNWVAPAADDDDDEDQNSEDWVGLFDRDVSGEAVLHCKWLMLTAFAQVNKFNLKNPLIYPGCRYKSE